MKSISFASGFVVFGSIFVFGEPPVQAQVVVAPGTVYTRPYVYVNPRSNSGVLPGFAPRGGIGTTPFLGNTRGLGAYSHNFDNDYRRPATVYRTNTRRWGRRNW